MKIININNIVRKDFPIYYRRYYTGTAVMELLSKPFETNIEFTIEQKPTGQLEISTTIPITVDYPLVPLQKELKKFIGDLDAGGKLPD